jgi:cytochrome c-type biogenesis protein CcmH/NrfG
MSLAQFYHRVINWPGTTGLILALTAAVALLVIAGVLLYLGKVRWSARGLGLIGLLLLMFVLWAVHKQTIARIDDDTGVTVLRHRHTTPVRVLALVALICVPVAAVAVMTSVFRSTQRWLREMVPSHLRSGRRHHIQKEYVAALREYNQAIKTAPELAEPYCRRGSVYHAMGESALALADFDRAIERDPQMAAAYLHRGRIRTESGDLENALADFGQLMCLKVNDAESYLNRGICLVKKGLVSAAAADFERVLKLTNHSDFADPARNYLRYCQEHASLPPSFANGSPFPPSPTLPKVQEQKG